MGQHASCRGGAAGRRTVTTGHTLTFVGLVAIALLGTLAPGDAMAGQKSFIGAWIVDVTPDPPGPPPFRNLASVGPDGLNVVYDPEFGAGHGLWKKTGPREFAIKFIQIVPASHPIGAGTITVTSTVTVDGDTATGPFTTVFDTTNVQATFTGSVVLTRITFD